jgi:replication-associated recombination protein RarA
MNLIEKYKPKRLADLVIPNDKIRFYLEDMADGLVINNLLLTGTQGSQKTTVAKLLPELIEGYSPFVNVVRGETDLNIQKALVPLHNLVNFGGISSQKYQYVLFEELDKVKSHLALFWQLMDEWGGKVILIATANSYMAIDKSVRSRFKILEMDPLKPDHFLVRAQTILHGEGIQLCDDYVLSELQNREALADIRKYMDVVCDIERNHLRGRITRSEYTNKPKLTLITNPVIEPENA